MDKDIQTLISEKFEENEKCWLDEIYRYSRTTEKNSNEVFLTACLSWLLSTDEELRNWLWHKYFQREQPESFILEHQWHISKTDIPDIILIWKSNYHHILIIEAKLEDDNSVVSQVSNYEKFLRNVFSKDDVVIGIPLVYSRNINHKNPLTWDKIYRKLQEFINQDSNNSILCKTIRAEFCRLLEEWGLLMKEPLRKAAFTAIPIYRKLIESAPTLLRMIVKKLSDDYNEIDYNTVSFGKGGVSYIGAKMCREPIDLSLYIIWGMNENNTDGEIYIGFRIYNKNEDPWENKEYNEKIISKCLYKKDWSGHGRYIQLSKLDEDEFFKESIHLSGQAVIVVNYLKKIFDPIKNLISYA